MDVYRHDTSELTDEECLKLIEKEVEARLEELDCYIKDDDGCYVLDSEGNRRFKMGTCAVQWDIQKKLMEERFGRNWKSPQDEFPTIIFD